MDLSALKHWTVVDGKLHRTLVCRDFIQAFGLMTQVALVAQAADHHPDWSNSYKTVRIDLFTHSAQKITELDIELAHKIDAIFAQLSI